MAVSGSGEIKLRDIYNEQQQATGEPSANTHISMDTLADSYGASAASTVTSRVTLSGDEDKITDFYGANYPGTFYPSLSFGNDQSSFYNVVNFFSWSYYYAFYVLIDIIGSYEPILIL